MGQICIIWAVWQATMTMYLNRLCSITFFDSYAIVAMGLWQKIGSLATFVFSPRVYLHMTLCPLAEPYRGRGPSEAQWSPLEPFRGPLEPLRGSLKLFKGPLEPFRDPLEPLRGPLEPPRGPLEPPRDPSQPFQYPLKLLTGLKKLTENP